MKLRQLQFAVAVAETKSFSHAAEICHATQPTLSNAISKLEEELGGRLFVRTTRSVELTPFGAYLQPYLQAVLDAQIEMEKAAQAFHNPEHKLLRIGFSPLVNVKLLDRVLAPYRQRHPDINIFFKECLIDDLSQRLNGGMIDVAIVPQVMAGTDFEHLVFYRDNLFYLPMADDPNSPFVGQMPIQDLPDTPVILTGGGCGLNGALTELFERQGMQLPTYTGQALTYQVIEEWSELGIGAGILPEAKLTLAKARALPLLLADGRPAAFSFEWLWKPAGRPPAHIADFVKFVQTIVPVLIEGGTV